MEAAQLGSCQDHPVLLFHEEKKLKTFVCLATHNILENREFVANSQRLAGRSGAEKMISAKQAKARAGNSPPAVSIFKVAGWLGDAIQIVDRS
jgi:hypothetical protein